MKSSVALEELSDAGASLGPDLKEDSALMITICPLPVLSLSLSLFAF